MGEDGVPRPIRSRRAVRLYLQRLGAAGIERCVGSVGDSYDNALAETIIGQRKTAVPGAASNSAAIAA